MSVKVIGTKKTQKLKTKDKPTNKIGNKRACEEKERNYCREIRSLFLGRFLAEDFGVYLLEYSPQDGDDDKEEATQQTRACDDANLRGHVRVEREAGDEQRGHGQKDSENTEQQALVDSMDMHKEPDHVFVLDQQVDQDINVSRG